MSSSYENREFIIAAYGRNIEADRNVGTGRDLSLRCEVYRYTMITCVDTYAFIKREFI